MYNITLYQIYVFLSVAEHLNISKAADSLYISQPSISKTIRRLEDSTGFKLFIRNNRGLSLTPEGEYLYSKFAVPYSNIIQSIQYASRMSKKYGKTIQIGYPSTYDASQDYDKLRALIAGFAQINPDIELIENLYEFSELMHSLITGQSDIVFLPSFVLSDLRGISTKPVCRSRMCLAMSSSHKLASGDTLILPEPETEIFYTIPYNDDIAAISYTVSQLALYGIIPKEVRTVPNFQSLIRIIRQGKGMGLCGYFSKTSDSDKIKYYPMPITKNTPYLTAAWRTDDISPYAQAFVDMIPDNPDDMTVF